MRGLGGLLDGKKAPPKGEYYLPKGIKSRENRNLQHGRAVGKGIVQRNAQVQDLAKGIYMVKATTDEGIITQKIIKQ